jgi:anti-anti-sigma factor
MKGHTLVLAGELDRVSAPVLETEIERLCEQGVEALTLDLRALTEIDSVGVAVVVHRCGWCARRGCEMTLVADARRTRDAFARAGAGERVTFVPIPVEDAEPAFETASEEPERIGTRAERPQVARPGRFALPGKPAFATASAYDGAGASALGVASGRIGAMGAEEEDPERARSPVSAG